MFNKFTKIFSILLIGILINLSVTGCGGGSDGDSSSGTPVESELVTITAENSEQVIDAVLASMDIGDDFENGPSLNKIASIQSASFVKSSSIPTFKKVLSYSKNLKTIAESGTIECSEGGSFSYDGSEFDGTIIFNNCIESGVTMDGTIRITASSDGKSGTLTYTNLSIILDENNKLFYTSARASFSFNSSYEVVDMSITINGYSVFAGERTDFDNYRLTMIFDSNYNLTLTIDGSIKSDCLDGWVEIKTNEGIAGNAYDDCPSSGQMVIIGNASSLTIDFNSDGSVDVSGSTNNHYDSCDELDSGVCSN